jgi:hypothetical protein
MSQTKHTSLRIPTKYIRIAEIEAIKQESPISRILIRAIKKGLPRIAKKVHIEEEKSA